MNTTRKNDKSQTNDSTTQTNEEVIQDVGSDEADNVVGGGGAKSLSVLATVLLSTACAPSSGGANGNHTDSLEAPASDEGIQYRMTATIASGQESYGCQLFQVPEGGLNVHDEDVYFGLGGHHVLLYKTSYKQIPSTDVAGVDVDAAAIHDCSEGVQARWNVTAVLGGSETMGGEGMLHGLPEGVAVQLKAGTVIVMSTHYINTSVKPLEIDARINLYTIPSDEVKVEAGLMYFNNPEITVPSRGESSARMRCRVQRDVSIVNLQSHMHARGQSFRAEAIDAQGHATEIYSTTQWQQPPVKTFDPLLRLSAGQAIEFQCDYRNTGDQEVIAGATSKDEMCQLIGPYFPSDVDFENCLEENDTPVGPSPDSGIAGGASNP